MPRTTSQKGFTLIELVMVIVILGVLAVMALPKFVDLKGDAQQSAVEGVAGSLSSAAAINYAARSANAANGVAITDCDETDAALQGGLPSGYTITSGAVAAGASASCTLTGQGSKTATFTTIGIN
jgi:MSHA pilin protein MshA